MRRYINLMAGTLILLFLGLIYGWSIFLLPLEKHFGWVRSQTANIFTLSMICFCLGGFCGGLLTKKIKSNYIVLVTSIIMFIGFFLSSKVTNIVQIYIFYGVLCGFGVGLSYNAVLSTIVKWFPDKPAFCSGILLMGFGSGGLLLSSITNSIIYSFGWGTAFVAIGIICIIVLGIGSFFIVPPKIQNTNKVEFTGKQFPPSKMLGHLTFWGVFIWALFAAACALAVIGQGSPIAVNAGADPFTAARAVGAFSICNGLGRVIMGFIYNKIPRKIMMLFVSSMFVIAALILIAAMNSSSVPLVFAGFIIAGVSYGFIPSFGVSIIREYFGSENYPINMSLFNCNLIISVIIGSSLTGVLVFNFGYSFALLVALATPAISALAIPLVKKP